MPPTPAPSPASWLARSGSIGVVAGISGPMLAAVMLAWPEQVAPGPLHYPFSSAWFLVMQVVFFTHHLGLAVVLVGLARSGAAGSGRLAGGAAWLAVAGAVALSLAELHTIAFAEMDAVAANAGLVGATYGVACNSIGLGLLVAGTGVMRARIWPGWHRYVPLVIGVATFVELTPGMFGGFVLARLAIGLWIFLFTGIGLGLRAQAAL